MSASAVLLSSFVYSAGVTTAHAEALRPLPRGAAGAAAGTGLAAAPSTPTVREFSLASELPASPPALLRTAGTPTETKLVAIARPRPVSGYGVVGATWEGPWPEGLRFAVRTRVGAGSWSGWQPLHGGDCPCAACVQRRAATGHGPNAGTAEFENARPGTDALAVGDVDEVQLRLTSPRGAVPEDLTLAVVDPEPTVTDPTAEGATVDGATLEDRSIDPSRGSILARAETTTVTASGSATVSQPSIFTRAQWGADERMRDGKPSYGSIKAGFVHHTVNANSYTREQVPSIIRGIYAYHTQSRGWSDIGYNFLVDRFGRIWEGRYGGIDRPVIGAHTYGYNHLAFAMSAIGNFDVVEPPAAMVEAYGKLMAWKLSLHGIGAKSTQSLSGKKFAAISGHRDAGSTACPGKYLYAKLGAIRTRAATIQAEGMPAEPTPAPTEPAPTEPAPTEPAPEPEPVTPGPEVARDLQLDELPDLVARQPATGRLELLAGASGPGFAARTATRYSSGMLDVVTGVGDVTGDGRPDLLTRTRRTGVTDVRPGRPDGLFGSPLTAARTKKFANADLVAGAGNLVGTPRRDLVTRDAATKRLWVYPGQAGGKYGSRRLLLASARHIRGISDAGDLDGDGRPDLLVTAGARLMLYPGAGRGTLGKPVILSRDWQGRDLTVAGHDLTGDGQPELLARDKATGRTWIYATDPGGRPGPRFGGWSDWSDLTGITAVGTMSTGATRFLGRTPSSFAVLDSLQSGWFRQPTATGRLAGDAAVVQLAGDWDGDGLADVITHARSTGRVWLYPGTGDGRLAPRVRLWLGWQDKTDFVVTADLTGDERPDVIARDPDGAFYVYPSDGKGGKLPRQLARSHMFRTDLITPAGFWNGDGVRDLIVRHARYKQLYLVPGTAAGTLGKPIKLTESFAAYDRIIGTGDFNKDGRPDLLAREAATGRIWLFPGTPTGLGTPEYVAPNMGDFDLIG